MDISGPALQFGLGVANAAASVEQLVSFHFEVGDITKDDLLVSELEDYNIKDGLSMVFDFIFGQIPQIDLERFQSSCQALADKFHGESIINFIEPNHGLYCVMMRFPFEIDSDYQI